MAGPRVDQAPERDPFVDLLLRPEFGGAVLAGTIACLLLAVWIRRRLRPPADDFGPEPTLDEPPEDR